MLTKRIISILMVLVIVFNNTTFLQATVYKQYYVYCDGSLVRDFDFDGMFIGLVTYGYKVDDEIFIDANIFGNYIGNCICDEDKIVLQSDAGTIIMENKNNIYTYTYKTKNSIISGKLEHPFFDINFRFHIPLGEILSILGKSMAIDETNRTVSVYYSTQPPKNIPVTGISLSSTSINLPIKKEPEPLTRENLAMFLSKSFYLPNTSNDISFTDVNPSNKNYSHISKAISSGILKKYEDGSFKPSEIVSRCEYSEAIFKALKYNITKRDFFICDIDFIDGGYSMKAHPSIDYVKSIVDAGLMELNQYDSFDPEGDMEMDTDGQLIPVIFPAEASNKKVSWKSSDESIATVDDTGRVIGNTPGKTIITVTTEDGEYTKSCEVTVIENASTDETATPEQTASPSSELSGFPTPTPTSTSTIEVYYTTPTSTATIEVYHTPTATPSKLKISVGSVNGREGETVTIPIRFDNVPKRGITNCDFMIHFNNNYLEFVDYTAGEIINRDSTNFLCNYLSTNSNVYFLFSTGSQQYSPIKNSGVFAYLKLKIKSGTDRSLTPIHVLNIGSFSEPGIIPIELEQSKVGHVTIYDSSPTPFNTNPMVSGTPSQYTPTHSQYTTTPTPKAESTPMPTNTTKVPVYQVSPLIEESTEKYPSAPDLAGHWAEKHILKLINMGIISGYKDGSIKPDSVLTRSEIAVILAKLKGLPAVNNPQNKFKDDNNIPSWARPYIYAAYNAGIIKGYDDNSFRASNVLSRAEISVMSMRAFDYKESSYRSGFADMNVIPKWALGYMSKAIELKIIKGYNDNTLRPNKKVTRAEAFSIISQCIDSQCFLTGSLGMEKEGY